MTRLRCSEDFYLRPSQFLADQMQGIALTSRIHLGAGLGGAAFAALWGAWSGASGLIAALNLAYREVETRSFARRSCHALLVAFGAGVFIVLAFALVALLPLTLDRLSADPALRAMVSFGRWPALAVVCAVALAVLYKFAPSRRAAKWRAGAGAALWLAASATFSLYASTVPSYNQALGVLGMLIMLLSWSYLTSFAVLFGAELNAELERQTSQDTTIGPNRRLGERGAAVADVKVNTIEATTLRHVPEPRASGTQS
jgi:membrane protein